MEQKAGEMQELVGIFRKQWDEFINQMEKLGNTLGTVQSHFEKLVSTRRNQLEKPMDRIKELELGQDEAQKKLDNE
jgi:DNA anti-recombination protein RmuC